MQNIAKNIDTRRPNEQIELSDNSMSIDGANYDSESDYGDFRPYRRGSSGLFNFPNFTTFNINKEVLISDSKCGYIYAILVFLIVLLVTLNYYKIIVHPEIRVTGFLEGKTYSEINGNIKLWEVRDTLVPGYPTQIFVPTTIRITPNQQQSKCLSPTTF